MCSQKEEVEKKVIEIIAQALDRPAAEIRPHDSLMDDLGAESIDFLDIRFRIERALKIRFSDEEIWEGSLRANAPHLIGAEGLTEEGLEWLKKRAPDFAWNRFPNGVGKADMPRLITPATIVDFLVRRMKLAG